MIIYSQDQCNAIRQLCCSGSQHALWVLPIPQSEKNHSRPQSTYFHYWYRLNGEMIERAYLNVRTEGSKQGDSTAGYVDLNTGEVVMDGFSDAFWNQAIAAFNPFIGSW